QAGHDASTASRPGSQPKTTAKFLRAFPHRHQPDPMSSINRQPAAVVADLNTEVATPRTVHCRTVWRLRLLHRKSHRARRRLGVADYVRDGLLRNPEGGYLHSGWQRWEALGCFEVYPEFCRSAALDLFMNRVHQTQLVQSGRAE